MAKGKVADKDEENTVLLYRCPGPYRAGGQNGQTYDNKGASSKEEAEKLLKKGWFLSLEEAMEADLKAKESKEAAPAPKTPKATSKNDL